ncbi:ubiquitin-protein ligase (E3) [Savitreella phatthalungensis]
MRSFGGQAAVRPRVNLGGRGGARQLTREEVLAKAAEQRELREAGRRRHDAALMIQRTWHAHRQQQLSLDRLRSHDTQDLHGTIVRQCFLGVSSRDRISFLQLLSALPGTPEAARHSDRLIAKMLRLNAPLGDDAMRLLPELEPSDLRQYFEIIARELVTGDEQMLSQAVRRGLQKGEGLQIALMTLLHLPGLRRLGVLRTDLSRQATEVLPTANAIVSAGFSSGRYSLDDKINTLQNVLVLATPCQAFFELTYSLVVDLDFHDEHVAWDVANWIDRITGVSTEWMALWSLAMMSCYPDRKDLIVARLAARAERMLSLLGDTAAETLVLAEIYSRLLVTMTDDEFPGVLSQERVCELVKILNAQLYATYASPDPKAIYNLTINETVYAMRGVNTKYVTDVLSRLLNQLYARNSRRAFSEPSLWLLPDYFDLRNFEKQVVEHMSLKEELSSEEDLEDDDAMDRKGYYQYVDPRVSLLTHSPWMVPFDMRIGVLRQLVLKDAAASGYYDHFGARQRYRATIRREHEFEDGYAALWEIGGALRAPLSINYLDSFGLDEAGIDGGGLTKEFLSHTCAQAFNPRAGLFVETADRLLYPNPSSYARAPEQLRHYEYLGRVVAKCIYEGVLIDVAFAPFFLNRWVGRPVRLDDLRAMDRDLYQGLLELKKYGGDVENDLSLDFTLEEDDFGRRSTITLLPDTPVTNSNRLHYIHLVCNYKLNARIAKQTQAFVAGLKAVVDPKCLAMFGVVELQALVGGVSGSIDVDDLEKHTEYGNTSAAQDPSIRLFWQVVREMDEADQRNLVKFVTSTPRPPLLGFSELQPKFSVRMVAGEDATRLPTASTCVNLLKLPRYKDKQTMRDKLRYAITSAAGFDLS